MSSSNYGTASFSCALLRRVLAYARQSAVHTAGSRHVCAEPWMLHKNEVGDVVRLLVVHDAQLAAVPKHRYLAAWDRLQRFVRGSGRSPIPTGVPSEREHEPY